MQGNDYNSNQSEVNLDEAFVSHSWGEMSKMLDKEMPVVKEEKDNKRYFFLLLLLLVGFAGGVTTMVLLGSTPIEEPKEKETEPVEQVAQTIMPVKESHIALADKINAASNEIVTVSDDNNNTTTISTELPASNKNYIRTKDLSNSSILKQRTLNPVTAVSTERANTPTNTNLLATTLTNKDEVVDIDLSINSNEVLAQNPVTTPIASLEQELMTDWPSIASVATLSKAAIAPVLDVTSNIPDATLLSKVGKVKLGLSAGLHSEAFNAVDGLASGLVAEVPLNHKPKY